MTLLSASYSSGMISKSATTKKNGTMATQPRRLREPARPCARVPVPEPDAAVAPRAPASFSPMVTVFSIRAGRARAAPGPASFL